MNIYKLMTVLLLFILSLGCSKISSEINISGEILCAEEKLTSVLIYCNPKDAKGEKIGFFGNITNVKKRANEKWFKYNFKVPVSKISSASEISLLAIAFTSDNQIFRGVSKKIKPGKEDIKNIVFTVEPWKTYMDTYAGEKINISGNILSNYKGLIDIYIVAEKEGEGLEQWSSLVNMLTIDSFGGQVKFNIEAPISFGKAFLFIYPRGYLRMKEKFSVDIAYSNITDINVELP